MEAWQYDIFWWYILTLNAACFGKYAIARHWGMFLFLPPIYFLLKMGGYF